MKKLIYILLFILPVAAIAQVDIGAFYGTNVARAYGSDTLVGFKAFNTNGAGYAGLLSISGTDSAGYGVNSSGQAAIQSSLSANAIRLYNPVGIPSTPAASAILDVSSTTKGFLLPRMTTAERDLIAAPATGLMIYNTTTSAFNYYNAGWQAIGGGGIIVGTTTITSGTSTRVPFNDSGVYGEDADLTWNKTTNILTTTSGFYTGGANFNSTSAGINIGTRPSMTGIGNVNVGNGSSVNITGSYNTALGDFAAGDGVAGNSNTFVGRWAGRTSGGSSNQIIIGSLANRAGTGANNTLVIGGEDNSSTFSVTMSVNDAVIGSNGVSGGYKQFYFGQGKTKVSPDAITLNVTGGSGTDNAGSSMNFATKSTGAAAPPNINFQTGTTLASGTTLQTPATRLTIGELRVTAAVPVKLPGYTVAGLPTGSVGDIAYVTDALAPTYGATIVGGGAVVTLVFYDGANWTAH